MDWSGKYRTPLQGFTSIPRPLDDVPPFVWHGSIRLARPYSRMGQQQPTSWEPH